MSSMSGYIAPLRDMKFLIEELIGIHSLNTIPEFEEITHEDTRAVLQEGGRFAESVLDPINQKGDREGAKFENGAVLSVDGFAQAYKKFCESGWVSVANDVRWGGQGLPRVLAAHLSEMWNASCMSFCLCPMLSAGVVHALSSHGSDQQKNKYLPNLVSGKWTGTMQLTEPQAGSDLSEVRTVAVPKEDHYLITGNKIYITWGDHDMAENIVHLVLARTPEAPPGVKGISLFIVPKIIVDESGKLGDTNDVRCLSIEKKLGIHASPTCVMSFGDNGGAKGYLVGEENCGLQYMFTMMNFARIEVGIEGMAISDRAYQRALSYSKQRIQGKGLEGKKASEKVTIINHPDVRRMLMLMKAHCESMRAMCSQACTHLDHALSNPDQQQRQYHKSMFDLLTPVVKGWCTEQSVELASLGIQVHGGMGFVEETGAAQYFRDARITPIYEGTTGIQANDLMGRKIAFEGGKTIKMLISEMEATIGVIQKNNPSQRSSDMSQEFDDAVNSLRESVDWLIETFGAGRERAFAGSVPLLKLIGVVFGGWLMLKSAAIAEEKLEQDGPDKEFYESKLLTAKFFMEHIVVMHDSLKRQIVLGADSVLALKEGQF